MSSSVVLTELLVTSDNDNFSRLSELQEDVIIKKSLWIFVPIIIFGAFSMFFPLVYALFPVIESETCVCSFYEI